MKSTDQELLEEAYNQVLLNELNYKSAIAAGLVGAAALLPQKAQAKPSHESPEVQTVMQTKSEAEKAYDTALKMVHSNQVDQLSKDTNLLKSVMANPELKMSLVRAILQQQKPLPDLLKTKDVQLVYPKFKIEPAVGG